ncbi:MULTISPECIES: hypothetical protein [Clostridium]|uniref:Uncharacterized protein n=1 Tax=Clostridium butyricum TaxID=1492 RepID=A0AAP9UE52_CLOBU|nr:MULTISPECIES: hypothetical protein [Clostridium]MBS4842070.1 hypothetical protein [Clostridium sp.]MBZ5745764.1 hypothetical protein [Clostridium butyricum]MCQ2016339.1 hypothetical protein [Clostridium butyricum]MCQ2020376.1 hypothetical protein [Clostridium butyricum]MDB2151726.1 hypothetical protein [Clostridium butyricum]
MMSKEMNDLFFVCSMIEKVSRETKQRQSYVVNKMGKENIGRLYKYADVFHCENPDKISYDLIKDNEIEVGTYDKISRCKYKIPSYWEIGEIYARLIMNINKELLIDTLFEVYNSWIEKIMDNYNSSFYYESPEYHLACYNAGEVLF